MLDITLDDLITHCGDYKRIGQEYVFQCPYCNDTGHDNMMFNPKKGIVWCHADKSHAPQLLREIMKEKKPQMTNKKLEIKQWEDNQENYLLYAYFCNDMLLGNDISSILEYDKFLNIIDGENDIKLIKEIANSNKAEKARAYLYEYKLIDEKTIKETQLGYDFLSNKWVFPIYTKDILKGFRYRGGDFTNKKIWTEIDTPSCLAYIGGNGKQNVYICEGEMDANIMVQMLRKVDKLKNSIVFTPAMGASSLERCINELNFNNYDKIHLCLDNDIMKTVKDRVSLRTTKNIIDTYDFIIDKTPQFTDDELNQGNKDISDWYKLHIGDFDEQK